MSKFGDPITEQEVREAKKVNYVALLILIAFLATAFYFYLQLQSKQRELETQSQMLSDSTENLKRIRTELEAAQNQLATRNASTMQTLKQLSTKIQMGEYEAAREMEEEVHDAVEQKKSSNTFVNLYTFGISPDLRSKTANYLNQQAVQVLVDQSLEKQPKWLADVPSVYYFPESGKKEAEILAKGLRQITKREFKVGMGESVDFPQNTKGCWINVHYPAKPAPKKAK